MQQPIEIPEFVFSGLRSAAPQQKWLSLLSLQLRWSGSSGPITSAMRQKVLWVDDSAVSEPNLDLADDADFDINDFFRDELDLANWTRVLVVVDVAGNDRAVAWTDPAGPPEADFVHGYKDPFWNYVDDNRAALEALGRATFR